MSIYSQNSDATSYHRKISKPPTLIEESLNMYNSIWKALVYVMSWLLVPACARTLFWLLSLSFIQIANRCDAYNEVRRQYISGYVGVCNCVYIPISLCVAMYTHFAACLKVVLKSVCVLIRHRLDIIGKCCALNFACDIAKFYCKILAKTVNWVIVHIVRVNRFQGCAWARFTCAPAAEPAQCLPNPKKCVFHKILSCFSRAYVNWLIVISMNMQFYACIVCCCGHLLRDRPFGDS